MMPQIPDWKEVALFTWNLLMIVLTITVMSRIMADFIIDLIRSMKKSFRKLKTKDTSVEVKSYPTKNSS